MIWLESLDVEDGTLLTFPDGRVFERGGGMWRLFRDPPGEHWYGVVRNGEVILKVDFLDG